MKTNFTLKLEATGSVITDIIADGLRIAKQLQVEVETEVNNTTINIHPLDTEDEIMEQYRIDSA